MKGKIKFKRGIVVENFGNFKKGEKVNVLCYEGKLSSNKLFIDHLFVSKKHTVSIYSRIFLSSPSSYEDSYTHKMLNLAVSKGFVYKSWYAINQTPPIKYINEKVGLSKAL